jgi:hypothetical protein
METRKNLRDSNQNTIRGRGTGWKMKGTQTDTDKCGKRAFRSLLVIWAIPKHFNKLLLNSGNLQENSETARNLSATKGFKLEILERYRKKGDCLNCRPKKKWRALHSTSTATSGATR